MPKSSKILLSVTIIFLIVSISLTYYRFFVNQDYETYSEDEGLDENVEAYLEEEAL